MELQTCTITPDTIVSFEYVPEMDLLGEVVFMLRTSNSYQLPKVVLSVYPPARNLWKPKFSTIIANSSFFHHFILAWFPCGFHVLALQINDSHGPTHFCEEEVLSFSRVDFTPLFLLWFICFSVLYLRVVWSEVLEGFVSKGKPPGVGFCV